MFQEFDFDLDLTAIFSLKKSPICSLDSSQIKHILNRNITTDLENFQLVSLKQDWSLSN